MTDHDPQCLVSRYPVTYDTDPFPWCTCHGRRLAMVEFTDPVGSADGGAVLAAGSLGNPEVAVSAAAGATVPAAAGNDPGGSRPA